VTERVDLPPCARGDVAHTCGSRCLPALMRTLPPAPTGWRWQYAHTAPRCWSVWLQQVGTVGRWYVVGLAPADTARELAAVVWSYTRGQQHPTN